MPPVNPPQDITPKQQLEKWVAGEPIHTINPDQCCPDFSCCKPELLADVEIRKAFAAANERDRLNFLMGFLGSMVQNDSELKGAPLERVHIAGRDPRGGS